MAAAAQSAMSAHRRSLATAAAAGSVLLALCFVPTAKATPEPGAGHPETSGQGAVVAHHTASASTRTGTATTVADTAQPHQREQLADTGIGDTAPYVVGGIGFLGAGGYLVARSLRGA